MHVEHGPKGPHIVYENKAERQFVDAVKRIEKATSRCGAWAIVDPVDPQRNGRVCIAYPRDGAGKLQAVGWLPGWHNVTSKEHVHTIRHYGWANGEGYDKASAAMSGATYYNTKGERCTIKDDGFGWDRQLQDAGYIVIRCA